VASRTCKARKQDGSPCMAPPRTDGDFCRLHDPDTANEVQEARRLGGLRRRKETTVAVAYDFEGLASVPQIRRLVEVAAYDVLGSENSLQRARTLAYLAQIAAKLLETGELEERVAYLEAMLGPRLIQDRKR
jgi:cytochrome c peroxidase